MLVLVFGKKIAYLRKMIEILENISPPKKVHNSIIKSRKSQVFPNIHRNNVHKQKKNHTFKNYQLPEKFPYSEVLLKNCKLCQFWKSNSVFVHKKSPI